MSSAFYKLYSGYSKQELFEVLLQPEDYQREAIDCAVQILVEKKWADEYDKLCEEHNAEQEKLADEENANNAKLAEYYRKAVDIKMQNHGYNVLHGDTDRFEERLDALNIDYFKEDSSLSRLNFNPEYQPYYFKTEDIDAVDEIGKDLGIFSKAYDSSSVVQKSQAKMLGIIFIGFVVLYGLYTLFKR